MRHQRGGQKLAPKTGRMMGSVVALRKPEEPRRWGTSDTIRLVQNAVCDEYGAGRKAANDLSAATDIPIETCRNVVEGRNAPSLANFFTMLESVPALRAAMRELLEMQGNVHSERFMHEAMTLMQKYAGRPT
jgi:hypothetical protein